MLYVFLVVLQRPKSAIKRLHKHEYTAKAIKRNNAPSNRDDDLTYVTSSSETASESTEHEQWGVPTLVMEMKQVCETATQQTCRSSSVVYT